MYKSLRNNPFSVSKILYASSILLKILRIKFIAAITLYLVALILQKPRKLCILFQNHFEMTVGK